MPTAPCYFCELSLALPYLGFKLVNEWRFPDESKLTYRPLVKAKIKAFKAYFHRPQPAFFLVR